MLNNVGILTVQHPLGGGNVVHESNRHKQQGRELRNGVRGHEGNVIQQRENPVLLFFCQVELFCQFPRDIVGFVHHQEGSNCDFGLASLGTQNRRDKTGQPHGTEVDIFSAEPLCFRHAVNVSLDAVFPIPMNHLTKLTGFTSASAFVIKFSSGIRYHASQSR